MLRKSDNTNSRGKVHGKKMGRPPLSPGEHRSAHRDIYLREEEADLLDSLAMDAGKNFSSWARDVLLAVASEKKCEVAES